MIGTILHRLIHPKREQSALSNSYHPSDHRLAALFDLNSKTYAGNNVTEDTSLNFSAVWRAVNLISSAVSRLPLCTYKTVEGKREEHQCKLNELLNKKPNPEMDARTFKETLTGNLLSWGNGYAEIVRDSQTGEPVELWPLYPNRVTPDRTVDTKELFYNVVIDENNPNHKTGGLIPMAPEDIFHIKGFSPDGICGYSPVRLAMQSIGLGLAAEEYGSRFFANGSSPAGVLSLDGVLTKDQYDRLRESWRDQHEGLENAHNVAVLESGATWQQIGIPPEEAQFLQTRQFQIGEIARWYGVPPHKLYDLSRATFSNIEHQDLEWLFDSLAPSLDRWESAANHQLIFEFEEIFTAFDTDKIIKADISSRYSSYSIGRQAGFLSVNEIRHRENMPPIEGGDTYLSPLNMAPAVNPAGQTIDTGEQQQEQDADALQESRKAASEAVKSQLKHLADIEAKALRRAAKRPGNFIQSVEQFYEAHEKRMEKALAPLNSLYQSLGMSDINMSVSDKFNSVLEVAGESTAEQLPEAIEGYLSRLYQTIEESND